MAGVLAGLRAAAPEAGGLLLAVVVVVAAVWWQRWWDARRARVQLRRRAERLAPIRARRATRAAAASRSAPACAARPVRPVESVRARPAPVPVFATAAAAPVPVVESTLPPLGDREFPWAVDPALVGRPPLADEPPVRPSRPLPPAAAGRRCSPAAGLTAALGSVLVVAGVVLALPGSPGTDALAGIAVLFLGWLGAVVATVSVGQRRARVAQYRGLHAASVPLYDRGRCRDFLVIAEARR
ncbi:hypothetical protein AB0M91_09205 [Micromonospora rifamycinica]|uniref:hypothetical protein n=1 Tax=Micromonospora rifamycinica TaxID=291594 RepID=UPI003419A437